MTENMSTIQSSWSTAPLDQLRLDLQVLTATRIKRRKPWPRLSILGESVYLMDKNRISILYMNTGKTQRKLPKLQSLVQSAVTYTCSTNGEFLGGLSRDGNLFLYHKLTDQVTLLSGPTQLQLNNSTPVTGDGSSSSTDTSVLPYVSISGCGANILLINQSQSSGLEFYLWQLSPNQSLFSAKPASSSSLFKWGSSSSKQQCRAAGSWAVIRVPAALSKAWLEERERSAAGGSSSAAPESVWSVHACFTANVNMGTQLSCSLIGPPSVNHLSLIIHSLHISSPSSASLTQLDSHWSTLSVPLHAIGPSLQPIRERGAVLVRQTNDGQMSAVAVNQLNSHMTRLVYVSARVRVMSVADLRGLGTRLPVTSHDTVRESWLVDMSWTVDDLLLVCITGGGNVCIMTRLGEPVLLNTHCNTVSSLNHGPKYFIPIHPLITVVGATGQRSSMTQRFSVCTHPALDLVLCSDGHNVTAVELIQEISCLSLMRHMTSLTNHTLRYIRSQLRLHPVSFKRSFLIGASDKRRDVIGRENRSTGKMKKKKILHKFEATPMDAVGESADWESETWREEMPSSGKIQIGDENNLENTADISQLLSLDGLGLAEQLLCVEKQLLHQWGLAASHVGVWTAEYHSCCMNISNNLLSLINIILTSPERNTEAVSNDKKRNETKNKKESDESEVSDISSLQLHNNNNTGKDSNKNKVKTASVVRDSSWTTRISRVTQILKRLISLSFLDKHSGQKLVSCLVHVTSCTIELVIQSGQVKGRRGQLVHTVSSCYWLLVYAENMIGQIYEPIGEENRNIGLKNFRKDRVIEKAQEYKNYYSTLLTSCWLRFYHSLLVLNHRVRSSGLRNQSTGDDLMRVMTAVLCRLEGRGVSGGLLAEQSTAQTLNTGDVLSAQSDDSGAVSIWMRELLAQRYDLTRTLLSLLYTSLLHYDLRGAVQLIELLLRRPANHVSQLLAAALGCEGEEEGWRDRLDKQYRDLVVTDDTGIPMPVTLCSSVRILLHSLSRCLSLSFLPHRPYIHPPHHPLPIPCLLQQSSDVNNSINYATEQQQQMHGMTDARMLELSRDEMLDAVRRQGLETVWTPDRALQYLLLGGLMCEGVWYLNQLSDWSSAVHVGMVINRYRQLCPQSHASKKLKLPAHLTPAFLLEDIVITALKDDIEHGDWTDKCQYDESSLKSYMTASLMTGSDLTVRLLQFLSTRLHVSVTQLSTLVPQSFYLPAPPLYCPQPSLTPQEVEVLKQGDPAVFSETLLRRRISKLIHASFLILHTSNTCIAATKSYSGFVLDTEASWRKHLQQKNPSLVSVLGSYSSSNNTDSTTDAGHVLRLYADTNVTWFNGSTSYRPDPVTFVMTYFRDLCGLTWMLHCRDKLSLSLRNKTEHTAKQLHRSSAQSANQYVSVCVDVLLWSSRLSLFTSLLNSFSQLHSNSRHDNDRHDNTRDDSAVYTVQGAILSSLIDLPQDGRVARLLAELLPKPRPDDGNDDNDPTDSNNSNDDVRTEAMDSTLDPVICSRLRRLVKDWQAVFVTQAQNSGINNAEGSRSEGQVQDQSSRSSGMTLSVLYESECGRRERVREERKKLFGTYHHIITSLFNHDDNNDVDSEGGMIRGVRGIECDGGYLEFLDSLFDVTITSHLRKDSATSSHSQNLSSDVPLLLTFADVIYKRELSKIKQRTGNKLQEAVLSTQLTKSPRKKRNNTMRFNGSLTMQKSYLSSPQRERLKSGGLFRSLSVGRVNSSENLSSFSIGRQNSLPRTSPVIRRSQSVDPSGYVGRGEKKNKNNNSSAGFSRAGSEDWLNVHPEVSTGVTLFNDFIDFDEDDDLEEMSVTDSELGRMRFTDRVFSELEKLSDWFKQWTNSVRPLGKNGYMRGGSLIDDNSVGLDISRSSNLGHISKQMSHQSDVSANQQQSAVKVNVDSKMVLYSLWLLVDWYENSRARHKTLAPSAEITVGMVHEASRKKLKTSTPRADEKRKVSSDWSAVNERSDGIGGEKQNTSAKRRIRRSSNTSASGDVSLNVSSLTEDDLRETMKQTLDQLTRSGQKNENNSSLATSQPAPHFITQQSPHSTERESRAENRTGSIHDSGVGGARDVRGGARDSLDGARADVGGVRGGDELSGVLQRAVRDEMRRIMEAQHRGIVSVLNALSDPDDLGHRPSSQGYRPSLQGQPGMVGEAEFVVKQSKTSAVKPSVMSHQHNNNNERNDDTFNDSITPISSDNSFLEQQQQHVQHKQQQQQPAPQQAMLDRFPLLQADYGKNYPFIQDTRLEKPTSGNPQLGIPNTGNARGDNVDGLYHVPLVELNDLRRSHGPGAWPLLKLPPELSGGKENDGKTPGNIPRFSNLLEALNQMNKEMSEKPDARSGFVGGNFLQIVGNARALPQGQVWGGDMYPVKLPRVDQGNTQGQGNLQGGKTQNEMYYEGIPFPLLRLIDVRREERSDRSQGQDLGQGRPLPEFNRERSGDEQSVKKRSVKKKKKKRSGEREVEGEIESDTHSSDVTSQRTNNRTTHSGFVLSPGLFDEYLRAEDRDRVTGRHTERGTDPQTSRQADVATSMTARSTGDNREIHEALRQYQNSIGGAVTRTNGSSLLPPDVYTQLRFPETSQQTNQSNNSNGRAYLNVVDLEWKALSDLLTSERPISQTANQNSARSAEQLAQPTKITPDQSLDTLQSGSVSERTGAHTDTPLFSNLAIPISEDRGSLSARSVQKGQKSVEFNDLAARFNAIAAIADHIEREFKNTRVQTERDLQADEERSRARQRNRERQPTTTLSAVDETEERPDSTLNLQNSIDATTLPQLSSLPPHLTTQLIDTARRSMELRGSVDVTELLEAFRGEGGANMNQSHLSSHPADQSEERKAERAMLLDWMERKRLERMKTFKAELSAKRQREKQPFKPQATAADRPVSARTEPTAVGGYYTAARANNKTTRIPLATSRAATGTGGLSLADTREHKKQLQLLQHTAERNKEAERLVYELLTDRPPQLLTQSIDDLHLTYNPTTRARSHSAQRRKTGTLVRSASARTARESRSRSARGSRSGVQTGGVTGRRPYTDLVRLQRPTHLKEKDRLDEFSRTRNVRPGGGKEAWGEVVYGKEESNMSEREKQQRLYGTRRVGGGVGGGGSRLLVPDSYRQRLDEWKNKNKTTTLRVPGVRLNNGAFRGTSSMTGSETGSNTFRMNSEQKTYAQRLKDLQTKRQEETRTASRASARARPYTDPSLARHEPPSHEDDVMSSLSMDDDVKRILYEGGSRDDLIASRSFTDHDLDFITPRSRGGLDLDSLSDLVALGEDAEGLDLRSYNETVQLDDLKSVVSGVSLASFIDWDQVDLLTTGVLD